MAPLWQGAEPRRSERAAHYATMLGVGEMSAPIAPESIPASQYGIVLDAESQQKVKELFHHFDADGNGILTRDDFVSADGNPGASGRLQLLWTTVIRKFFDEDGGGEVTLPEMISKLSDMAQERPGDYTLHNSAVPVAQLIAAMNAAFNANFKAILGELSVMAS